MQLQSSIAAYNIQKMSNNRIFSGVKGSEPQGRNVNLTGNMLKRAPIFTHVASDKQESSPFANYNCRSAESLFSSQSQQSIQDERLSIDAVRQIIKQELVKSKGEEDPNKKLVLTLQAQLKDIKQKLNESEADNAQKLQQLRQTIKVQMKQEVTKMGREVDEEITNRLRIFFQKANVELKKDILKVASEQFLSFSYGEDLESRLEAINETLDNVNSLIRNKEVSTEELQKKISSINLNENLQNKLAKIEKQAEGLKKSMAEHLSRTKQLQEWKSNELSKSMDESLTELRHKIQKIKEEQTYIMKPVKLFESKSSIYDNTLNKLQHKLEETQRNCEEVKGQLIDLHKRMTTQQLFKQNSSRTSQQLKSFVNSSDFQSSLLIGNNSNVFKQFGSEKKSSSNENTEINDFANIGASTSTEYQEMKKSIYQVDNQGYLMDGESKYILTDNGEMIRLEGQQIKALLQSKVIEVIET